MKELYTKISLMIPAATVLPDSLNVNLPRDFMSENFSKQIG